ncbi:MAG: hypothetical protein K0Q55_4020, partial [Verrucomicrobia bacterium]|nr:hypothetical protein [Verrucomicrobiota bacterium]
MEWLIQNWFWCLLAVILVVFSIAVTRHAETGRYRIRLIFSMLILEGWFYLVTKATSLVELLALGFLGVGLMRVCMPALSHIIAQKMADKATDAMFGEREPAPPSLERGVVRELRKQRRQEDAIKHLETVLEAKPDDFESRFTLACIYAEDLFDLPAAEREMKRILTVSTISPSVQAMARQRLELWRAAYQSGSEQARLVLQKQVPPHEAYAAANQPPPVPPVEEAEKKDEAAPEPIREIILNYQSVEDLCQAGNYGSAITMIDQIIEM